MDEKYSENLIRFIGTATYNQLVLTVARDLFGRPFFQLGQEEKIAVYSTVNNLMAANMNWLTPDLLKQTVDPNAPKGTMGFVPPKP